MFSTGKMFHFPAMWFDGLTFGNPATHFPRKKHPGGVFTVWLGPGIHTAANFLAASEGHISLGPASRKVALNPGYVFFLGGGG